MTEALIEKIDRIEALLVKVNAKIDNFLGFENLEPEEKKEIEMLRKEVASGVSAGFDEVFEE